MPKPQGPFHVVAHYFNDQFGTFAIYLNNRKYLVPPAGKPLRRKAAFAICDLLNGDPRFWPELPKTRDQLMRVG